MTHKEDALELVENFYREIYNDNRVFPFSHAIIKHENYIRDGKKGLDSINTAIKCSLLLVDKMIKSDGEKEDGSGWCIIPYNNFDNKWDVYWRTIRQELKQLTA